MGHKLSVTAKDEVHLRKAHPYSCDYLLLDVNIQHNNIHHA